MARTKREILQKCKWAEDEDGLWQTDCGQEFSFIDAGPNENHMRFCCYCGSPLKAETSSDTRPSDPPAPTGTAA